MNVWIWCFANQPWMKWIICEHRAQLTPLSKMLNLLFNICFVLKKSERFDGNVYVIWTWTVPWGRLFISFTLILLAASLTEHNDMGCQDITVIIAGPILRLSQSLPTLEGAETTVCAWENRRFGFEKDSHLISKAKIIRNYRNRCIWLSWSVSRSWITVSKVPPQLTLASTYSRCTNTHVCSAWDRTFFFQRTVWKMHPSSFVRFHLLCANKSAQTHIPMSAHRQAA